MSIESDLEARLSSLAERNLLRRPHLVHGPGPRVLVDGRPAICFCSNDYLGLTSHGQLRALAASAHTDEPALGSAASRLISGTRPAHLAAERRLAALVGAPAALLFSSGYAANVGSLSALLARGDVAFSDELNHASLIDGLRLSRARVQIYPHGDTSALAELLRAHRPSGRRAWIVTDSIFSMDGDAAPLVELRRLADQHDAGLFVDEAHALGVVGPAGLSHVHGVVPDAMVGTLGKAFGVTGAFVAGSVTLRTFLENTARSYVFSTAPPASLLRAVLVAADLVAAADDRRRRLAEHAAKLRSGLAAQGWTVPPAASPIVPVIVGDPSDTLAFSQDLLDHGYFVRAIRPPTVPVGTSRLRVVPTAIHTDDQIEGLLAVFGELRSRIASSAR